MCDGTWLPFYGPLLIVCSLPGTLRSPTLPSQPTLCCQPPPRFHQKLTSSRKTPMIPLGEGMPSSLNSAPPFVLLFQLSELPFKNSPKNPDEPASFHSPDEEAETQRGKTSSRIWSHICLPSEPAFSPLCHVSCLSLRCASDACGTSCLVAPSHSGSFWV